MKAETPLQKLTHDKRTNFEESQHVYVCNQGQTECEVGAFSREISQLSKIRPPPSLRSRLSSRLQYVAYSCSKLTWQQEISFSSLECSRLTLVACYQLVRYVFKVGFALIKKKKWERGRGASLGMGCIAHGSCLAWLQKTLVGTGQVIFCIIRHEAVELHFWHCKQFSVRRASLVSCCVPFRTALSATGVCRHWAST